MTRVNKRVAKKYKKGGKTSKKDACYYKVVRRYGPKTSAYRSGAMAKCRVLDRDWETLELKTFVHL